MPTRKDCLLRISFRAAAGGMPEFLLRKTRQKKSNPITPKRKWKTACTTRDICLSNSFLRFSRNTRLSAGSVWTIRPTIPSLPCLGREAKRWNLLWKTPICILFFWKQRRLRINFKGFYQIKIKTLRNSGPPAVARLHRVTLSRSQTS